MSYNPADHEASAFGDPLDAAVVEAWHAPAIEDVVPRGAPDPGAVAALEALHGNPVTMAFHTMTEHGVQTEYVEALLLVGGTPYPCDD